MGVTIYDHAHNTCSGMWRASKVRENIQYLAQERTRKGLHCTWIDENGWKTVCSQLYSGSSSERRRGVARVAAWKARGVVPFPVEITADIVDSQLWEEEHLATILTEQTFALLYSMAVTRWAGRPRPHTAPQCLFFIRFINGVSDYGMCRGRAGRSILEVVSHVRPPS